MLALLALAGCRTGTVPSGMTADPALSLLPERALPGETLVPTLELRDVDGVAVAWQNGTPVPTFEPQERDVIPLGGQWRARRFAADHGVTMARRTREWVRDREREAGGITGRRFDDASLARRTLPAPENRISPATTAGAVERYEDGVWYRRTFDVAGDPSGRAFFLKFLGASYVVDVWVNGAWIGWHEGGYTPFAFELTGLLRTGENSIALRVDNPPWGSRKDTIPAAAGTDFFNYTGIVQDLYLESVPLVSLSRVDAVALDAEGGLRLRAVLYNASDAAREVRLAGRIHDTDPESPGWLASPLASSIRGRPVVDLEARTLTVGPRQALPVTYTVRVPSARTWALGNPNLYVASLDVAGASGRDTLSTQVALRTIGVDRARIVLNGEPVFLAGVARHEEWPGFGRTAAWDRIVADLGIIRGLSATMVRTAHYPNHVFTYLALDRLGLAAMSEIPLWQFEPVHFQVQAARGIALQMWREMIFSQYNRGSVLLWSTQNESTAPRERLAHNERLVRDLRERYDDGRLVTQSAAADRPGPDDPTMAPLDVAGWTMYFGVFHGSTPYEGTRDFLLAARRRWPAKPILNTEYGYWSGESEADAGRQLAIVRDTLRALEEAALPGQNGAAPLLSGMDYWTAFDWFVNHNKWVQTMGLYRMDRRTRKPAADLVSERYGALAAGMGRGGGAAPPPE